MPRYSGLGGAAKGTVKGIGDAAEENPEAAGGIIGVGGTLLSGSPIGAAAAGVGAVVNLNEKAKQKAANDRVLHAAEDSRYEDMKARDESGDRYSIDSSIASSRRDADYVDEVRAGTNDSDGQVGEALETVGRRFRSPGAADWGGDPGAVERFRQEAKGRMTVNDDQQGRTSRGMADSLHKMRTERGDQAVADPENLAAMEATRRDQMGSLKQNFEAAKGNAPSVANYQMLAGQDAALAQRASMAGSSRGLSGLSGAQASGANAASMGAMGAAGQHSMERGAEQAKALGLVSAQAGQVRGQDLSGLEMSNGMKTFNSNLNDNYKVQNANQLAADGRLGVAQSASDLAWLQESQHGTMKQFGYDQNIAAIEAGNSGTEAAAARAARDFADSQRRQLVGGSISAGLTLAGTVGGGLIGGPVGAGLGGSLGGAAGSGVNGIAGRYY